MSNLWRRLDNTAKIFSVEEKKSYNTFRLSVVLNEEIDSKILKSAVIKSIDTFPSYKVKIRSGLFWNYLDYNLKEPIVEEENQIPCNSINLRKNNNYLFKVTYFNNKINLDVFHVLTDGIGAALFFKSILYNYLDKKYDLKSTNKEIEKDIVITQDEYLKNVEKNYKYKKEYKKAFLIKDKSNSSINKTYHYILDLEKVKSISKMYKVSITEYLTAHYIYALYRTIYNKSSDKDIVIAIPIDLRNHYQTQTFSNFFTCMNINGNVVNNENVSFNQILNQVHTEFRNKLTLENVKSYLFRDVKLGTNIVIRLIPLVVKKIFMKYFGKLVNQSATSTLSNIGLIKIDEQYKEYIDNIMVMVNAGKVQKIKCTICSYENKLTVTINSNLVSNDFENEFYRLLEKYIGKVRLESNMI